MSDREIMVRALRLAKQGLNTTTPNPRVGCVLVDDAMNIVGEGFHARAGEAHAEINALAAAGEKAKGATAYVTLEPCSHRGRTGPCADALIAAGVARVVYAMEDPNPEVSGAGLDKLRAAGIIVDGPLLESEARELNLGFIKRMRQKIPYIRCKMAMSVDGRTAMASGESKWITGPDARADVHKLRARSCAIVTGVESVIHDDPALTVRLSETERQPLRVIVDTHSRCPLKADILNQPGNTIIACAQGEAKDDGRNYWELPQKDGHISLYALVRKLADEGCNEVLVETGATLAGAFAAAGLIDEFIIYVAPKLMGSSARPLFHLPIDKMRSQLPLSIEDIRRVGEDWRITAYPDPEG
ncbi:bifunctional diaminohydroxyphosphoribosylaminopyrimidine deaminase/5-amino-6-(5-phosphoribosylamino)uracil reductase RibD [Agarilytica rhodophyticola]|uniref:bifunctional diaminohydroxyphosphoribosylaminopyrimidine deaminase/5-amino-6-(5-phosphoribosylamino)uracil reductase RibD n=1 Tax=Agarilytica rhodophyticola TaxID=1737490 RepID=UPI000B3483CE|nr:bifunctional diaminohydroxyphosphoribosylaminopyrimidine deaminase/5-amino-6-(5-phosphoribosylamino)uracil reductase RibD [Agarilytica rhodophyticola]